MLEHLATVSEENSQKAKANELQVRIIEKKYQEAKKENEEYDDMLRAMKTTNEAHRQEIKQKDQHIHGLEKKYQDTQKQHQECQNKVKTLQKLTDQKLKEKELQIRDLKKQNNEAMKKNDDIGAANRKYKAEVRELSEKRDEVVQKYKDISKKNKEYEGRLQRTVEENQACVSSLEGSVTSLTAQLNEKEAHCEVEARRIEDLQNKLAQAEVDLECTSQKLQSTEFSYHDSLHKTEQLDKLNETLQQEKTDLGKEVEEMRKTRAFSVDSGVGSGNCFLLYLVRLIQFCYKYI